MDSCDKITKIPGINTIFVPFNKQLQMETCIMKRQFWSILLCSLLMLLLAGCSHTHNFDEKVTRIDASCEEPGLIIQECRCGNEKQREILPLGHEYEVDAEVASSCQAEGYITYVCTRCHDSYTEATEHRKYTATELNDMYLESVGELVVYDKQGNCISLGSCFVYSQDGLLVTNYHVIEGGYSAEVTIGRRTYKISVVEAYDKLLDIAILKITANNLKPVKLCRLEHKTGETVYALGNSQGMTSTFTKGMITYSDRESGGVHYVQHDAAISSGSSGGPLINEYGEVIGINTLTLEDSQNLNFAIRVSEIGAIPYHWCIPMRDLYELERNAYQKVSTYLLEKGTYRPEFGTYLLMLDSFQDTSLGYKIWAEYVPDDAVIDCYLVIEDDFYTGILLDDTCSGSYDWYCFNNYNEMAGVVNAQTLTYDTRLAYDYTDITSHNNLESMRGTASIAVTIICDCITSSFQEIGVDAADFGFDNF